MKPIPLIAYLVLASLCLTACDQLSPDKDNEDATSQTKKPSSKGAPARVADPGRVKQEDFLKVREGFQARLDRKITVELDDTPVDEALAFFGSLLQCGVILDPGAIQPDKIMPRVTLQSKDVPAETVLSQILEQADLIYYIEPPLIITSKTRHKAAMVKQVRRISDIDLPDFSVDLYLLFKEEFEEPGADYAFEKGSLVVTHRPSVLGRIDLLLAAHRKARRRFEKSKSLKGTVEACTKLLDQLEKGNITTCTIYRVSPNKIKETENQRKHIQGYPILASKDLPTRKERAAALNVLASKANYSEVGANCFIPGMAYRIQTADTTVDIVICLQCSWSYLYTDNGKFYGPALSEQGKKALQDLYNQAFPAPPAE